MELGQGMQLDVDGSAPRNCYQGRQQPEEAGRVGRHTVVEDGAGGAGDRQEGCREGGSLARDPDQLAQSVEARADRGRRRALIVGEHAGLQRVILLERIDRDPLVVGRIDAQVNRRPVDGLELREIVFEDVLIGRNMKPGCVDVRTGEAKSLPCREPIDVFNVKLEGNVVFVAIDSKKPE